MANAQLRFQIYSSGGTTGSVEYTFDHTRIRAGEDWAIGGQDVRPLDGRAESAPWSVAIVDYSTAVTSILSNSSGRMLLLGRLADFAVNLDSSGYRTLGRGRIADVMMNDDVGSYRFVMDDELMLARRATIFTETTTVYLYPAGLQAAWADKPARQPARARLESRSANLALVVLEAAGSVSQEIMREIYADFRTQQMRLATNSTSGNFQYLRCNIAGTDYEVFGIGRTADSPYAIEELLTKPANEAIIWSLWVVDPSATLGSPSTDLTQGGTVLGNAYLHMPNAPPSEVRPLHIGGTGGIHPFQLVKDIWDGNYGNQAIRYDSTALSNLIDDKSFPPIHFRITEPRLMDDWLSEHIFGPLGVVPFVNQDGRIEPQIVLLPTTQIAGDPTNLYSFTSTNLRLPHPNWSHSKRELLTVARWAKPQLYRISDAQGSLTRSFPADMLKKIDGSTELEHDGVARYGYHLKAYEWPDVYLWLGAPSYSFIPPLAQARFDRFGDGPIWGRLSALSSGTSDVTPGDFVNINLASFPNVGIQGRGGNRVVQIMSRTETPYGPDFGFLDAGLNTSSLPTPNITLTTSTGSLPVGYHTLHTRITGLTPPTAATTSPFVAVGFSAEVAPSASTLAANSTAWMPIASNRLSNITWTTDLTQADLDVTHLRSGSTWWARARQNQASRFRSAWDYTTSGVETVALTAPSGLSATGYTYNSIDLTWTNSTASTGYEIEVLGSTRAGTMATTAILPPGTNRYRMAQLSSGTTYDFGVRYRDSYGGISAQSTLTTETQSSTSSTGTTSASIPSGFHLIRGLDSTQPIYY